MEKVLGYYFSSSKKGRCRAREISDFLQIKEKKYFQKYQDSEKEVILVGASFSTKQRNISGWTSAPARSRMAKLTAL